MVAHRFPFHVAPMISAAKEAKHNATDVDTKRKTQEAQPQVVLGARQTLLGEGRRAVQEVRERTGDKDV